MDIETICGFIRTADIDELIWRYYVNEFEQNWAMESAHAHRAFELILTINGRGIMQFAADSEKLKTGNILAIFPEVPHRFHTDDSSKCSLLNIHFKCDETPLKDYFSTRDISEYKIHSVQSGYFKLSNNPAIAETMKRIVAEMESKEEGYVNAVKLLFSELFILILRTFNGAPGADENIKKYIADAKKYIEENMSDTMAPEQIANALHISAGYLMHIFHHSTGMTVMDYLNIRRIEKSKVLLYESDEKITNVAVKVGIANSQYFSTLFKKQTGMTPREYRKKMTMINISDRNIFK